MRRLVGTAAFALMLPLLVDGHAALLPPVTIDANTAQDALDVGAAIGNRRAWAGFVQKTQGVQRLYVAYGEEGAFRAPFLSDRGNAVTAAALTGNGAGDAIVVFTEQVAGKGVLFGRRLSAGQAGPVLQISAAGDNAVIPSALVGLHHVRVVAINAAGAAVTCYLEADSDNVYAAMLAPNAAAWARVGPLKSTRCDDIAVDARGHVIVVGPDANMDLSADRIVSGQLRSELIDADGMDEPSVALSSGGTALAFARVEVNNDFAAAAWRKRDIAQDGAWDKLGRADVGARAAGENTEYPRGALNAAGAGVVTFRVNNAGNTAARIYFAPVDATRTTGALATPQKLADVKVGNEAIPNVDASGNPIVAYQGTAANGKSLPFVHVFAQSAPGPALPLVPASNDDVELLNVPSFVTDTPGNLLALLRRYSNPTRAVAAFGDFLPPTLGLESRPRRPRLGQRVTLSAGAADSFATLASESVEWRFSTGAVQGAATRRASSVSVRFLRAGRNRVVASATDRAGNRAEQAIQVAVAPARPLLRARPLSLARGKILSLVGARFVPTTPVTLLVRRRSAPAQRVASKRTNAEGGFVKRFRVPARWRSGRYVVQACQLRCRVKARVLVRIR